MLFMVELHYELEHRDEALSYFWEHGSTHYFGHVVVESAWVASQERVAYAVVRADGREELSNACEPLERFGKCHIREVMNVHQL